MMFSFTFYVKRFYALIFCIMHAKGVRVHLIVPTQSNYPILDDYVRVGRVLGRVSHAKPALV